MKKNPYKEAPANFFRMRTYRLHLRFHLSSSTGLSGIAGKRSFSTSGQSYPMH